MAGNWRTRDCFILTNPAHHFPNVLASSSCINLQTAVLNANSSTDSLPSLRIGQIVKLRSWRARLTVWTIAALAMDLSTEEARKSTFENDSILRNPYSNTSTSVIRCYEGSLEYLEWLSPDVINWRSWSIERFLYLVSQSVTRTALLTRGH